MIAPRLIVNFLLLLAGSDWLNATFHFESLLLNAVALEFILYLKDSFYEIGVSGRMMIDMKNLQVQSLATPKVGMAPYFNVRPILFTTSAVLWVIVYLKLQRALPGFWGSQAQKDLNVYCADYLKATTVFI